MGGSPGLTSGGERQMARAEETGQRAARTARQAADSKWIERTARVGLAARGLGYVLIGILAFQIAFVNRAKEADQQGAFQTLAQSGFGKAVLWLVILGFVGDGPGAGRGGGRGQ